MDYYCKVCDQIDPKGLHGHHTRCSPVVVNKPIEPLIVVVNTPTEGSSLVVNKRTLDRHKKTDARKKYQIEWMRKKRECLRSSSTNLQDR